MTGALIEGTIMVDTFYKIPKQEGKTTPEEKMQQEELLLAHGVPPKKIALFQNPTGGKNEIRKQSQKVSNDHNRRKKAKAAQS